MIYCPDESIVEIENIREVTFMKKQLILDLIRYHVEGNNEEFRRTALEIVDGFRKSGDYDLAEFILALLSDVNTLTTQEAIPPYALSKLNFLTPVDTPRITLPLPNLVSNDIDGIVHAVQRNMGVSRFLFEGKPGTGKTESAKLIARLLRRRLYEVSCSNLVDSRLGQTAKNIRALFDEIASVGATSFSIFLFDEIDSIALDRVNNNDIREMGRATSTIIKGLDQLPRDIVVIATTNLYEKFDKALSRRFDAVINFDRYSKDDLIEIYTERLHSVVGNPRVRRLFSSIVLNDELQNIKFTLKNSVDEQSDTDFIIELLSLGMVIAWLEPQVDSIKHNSIMLGTKEEKKILDNHKNMIERLDTLQNQLQKMIRDYGCMYNSYVNGD